MSPRDTLAAGLCAAFITLAGCTAPAEAPPEPAPPSWSAAMQAGIAAGEYAPKAMDGSYRVTNRAQDLRGVFGERGLAVTTRAGTGEVTLTLRAWGRDAAMVPVEPRAPAEGRCLSSGEVDAFGVCLHRVDYAHPGLTEWWENRPAGLEQGFTVPSPPAGEGPLVFEMAVGGARVEVDGEEARLVREVGAPLRWGELVAWDEEGKELPAWMEAVDGGVRIEVDDSEAVGSVVVDPLLTTEVWRVESEQASANSGYSVASAGDVNEDGYGDVVVGAYRYDNPETDEGAAFLYLGSAAGLRTTAAATLEANQAGAAFGRSVASAGDVNGDGYGDVIVGASAYDNGASNEGAAFLYLGSATGLHPTPAAALEANQTNASFGHSVASAGDVNGDGYGDVVVGAYRYQNGAPDEGAAFLFLGSAAGLRTTAAATLEANQAGAAFGHSVASAGDVNGDGYGDVVVGAQEFDNGEPDEGAAFLFLGGAAGLGTNAAATLEANQAGAAFGRSVASAGDVNGDGYGDVVVGAEEFDNGEPDEGAAFLFLGSAAGLSTTAAATLEANQAGAAFGRSVASAGDTNGDGYGDVVVGASAYDNGEPDEGAAFLYLGSAAGLATTAAATLEANQADANFGHSVASAGDVDGDGYGDMVVGAYRYDNGASDEGSALLYLGSAAGLAPTEAWRTESNQAYAWFALSVASAGDVNGDGYDDVVVGASAYDNGEPGEGAAFLYLGSATGLGTTAATTLEANQADAFFGWSVASAGDVNGDGFGDVVVAAYLYDHGETDEGAAFVYLGSALGLATTPAWMAESGQTGAGFGGTVASAGDVNGDGYGDLVVGARFYNNGTQEEGMALVYLGGISGLTATAAWTAESNQARAWFGWSVASAGDVNGDGYGDLVVGAPTYDGAIAGGGAAFIYLGSSSGLAPTAAWTMEPGQVNAFFGWSVSSAGDVNGDGYGDLVVGAPNYDNGRTDEGGAFVYLGSPFGLDPTAAETLESNQGRAMFGGSVASAGDVNGDGYGDVAVGAYGYDGGATDAGAAFVYLGSANGLTTTAAWIAESDQADALYGYSMASAGDVNGDGYGDVVVGAAYFDGVTIDEGSAFVYLGNSGDGTTPLARASQARQPGTTTPIFPGLVSTSPSSFTVAMTRARTSWGRGQVKLQVEVKALGEPFDGTGLITSSSLQSTGLTGASLQQTLGALDAATGYHWRARVLVSPAEGRPQGWGPWFYGGLPGDAAGGHVFTAAHTLYADADGDGYGSSVSVLSREPTLPGFVDNNTDCDDDEATAHPGGVEVCDGLGIDEDCDGAVDEAGAVGELTWYLDGDGDGVGGPGAIEACVAPSGYVDLSGDCDDGDPGATMVCSPAMGVVGSCPGRLRVMFDRLTPSRPFTVLRSFALGSVVIPPLHPCGGAVTGLDGASAGVLLRTSADARGRFMRTFTAQAGLCGAWVQVVDDTTCLLSEPVQL
jgi:hypothetical protein